MMPGSPINVLNVVRYPIGGIRNYLRYTYSKLDPALYRTTIVTVERPEAHLLPAGMAPLPVDLRTVPESGSFVRLAWRVRRLLHDRTYQIVHSQGMTAGVVTALSNRSRERPHVLTLHETFRREQFEGPLGALKQRVLALVMARVDSIIVVSRDAFDNLRQFIPLSAETLARVEVIRNGVSVDTLVNEANTSGGGLRGRLGVDTGTPLLGYVGRFMPEKGFDVLIEAVDLLRRREATVPAFKVVAVNDGAFVREYQQRITDRGLLSWFLFTGFQSSVAGTLTELDAVIMPSLREAGPLVPMEAMVLGCPVIASDCVGLRELTAGTPAIQSVAGDAASLADAIARFLGASAAHKARALDYVSTARQTFDSSVAAGMLTALFTRGLQARSRVVSSSS
jgi:glycosyltransferase involved in cell wall biosynthesis